MIQFLLVLLYLSSGKRYLVNFFLSGLFAFFQLHYFGYDSDLEEYFSRTIYFNRQWFIREPIFWAILGSLRILFTQDSAYILFYSLINMLILRLVKLHNFSVRDSFLFLSPFAVFGYSNIVRQYFAVCFFILLLRNSRNILLYLTAFVHNSTIFLFPVFRKKNWPILFGFGLYLVFFQFQFGSEVVGNNNLSWIYIFIALAIAALRSWREFMVSCVLLAVVLQSLSFDMVERVFSAIVFIQLCTIPNKLKVLRFVFGFITFIFGMFIESYVRFV